MQDTHELRIQVDDEDSSYTVEHRFPSLPEPETMVALKDEAIRTFRQLHDSEPNGCDVDVMFLPAEERDTEEEAMTETQPTPSPAPEPQPPSPPPVPSG